MNSMQIYSYITNSAFLTCLLLIILFKNINCNSAANVPAWLVALRQATTSRAIQKNERGVLYSQRGYNEDYYLMGCTGM
jgi:hypothetical protein